jgi:Cys-rich four helix bundle protein (predicted Tat secretion target)
MERRQLLAWMGGLGAAGSAAAAGGTGVTDGPLQLAQAAPPAHDHAAMMAAGSAAPAPRLNDALIPAYQACTRAAETCIAHCQQLLAQGDKSLGACLRTALDADTVCSAVLKLAGLNSRYTAAMAKQSIPVMQACVEACKEHVDHHAECKACHDACLKAIDAAKGAV